MLKPRNSSRHEHNSRHRSKRLLPRRARKKSRSLLRPCLTSTSKMLGFSTRTSRRHSFRVGTGDAARRAIADLCVSAIGKFNEAHKTMQHMYAAYFKTHQIIVKAGQDELEADIAKVEHRIAETGKTVRRPIGGLLTRNSCSDARASSSDLLGGSLLPKNSSLGLIAHCLSPTGNEAAGGRNEQASQVIFINSHTMDVRVITTECKLCSKFSWIVD